MILKTKIEFPSTQDTDEASVLSAFQKLVGLFWSFDQSGVFETLDGVEFDTSSFSFSHTGDTSFVDAARRQLNEANVDTKGIGDVQAVDIALTRQWMRVILWRLSESHRIFTPNEPTTTQDPVQIANEFLTAVQSMPETAIEAHGPGLELKVFEIASSVVDAVVLGVASMSTQDLGPSGTPEDILARLHRLLKRNKHLDSKLRAKIATIQQSQQLLTSLNTGLLPGNVAGNVMDLDIEQQLQAHGFDFSEPLRPDASPSEDSLTSDNSPMPNLNPSFERHLSSSSGNQVRVMNQQQMAAAPGNSCQTSSIWAHQQQPLPSFDTMHQAFENNNPFQYDMSMYDASQSFDGFGMPHTGWTPKD